MTLKAVLFDFNGVIINDEPVHQKLIEEILLSENLRPSAEDYWKDCLGRSDRACLKVLLEKRGRIMSDQDLTRLISKKAKAYRHQLENLSELPIYPGVKDLIDKICEAQLIMGVVSSSLRSEVEFVLEKAQLRQYFSVIIAGDDIKVSKPEPDGYLLAVERLNQQFPELNAKPSDCLAIEDTPAGIEAAKRAGMQVVGVANTYPFHMLQRQADWTVDYLNQLELERVQNVYTT